MGFPKFIINQKLNKVLLTSSSESSVSLSSAMLANAEAAAVFLANQRGVLLA